MEIQKNIEINNVKHGIYPPFTLEAGRLSSTIFHYMYQVRSPPYPHWFTLYPEEEKGRIDKVVEWINYS